MCQGDIAGTCTSILQQQENAKYGGYYNSSNDKILWNCVKFINFIFLQGWVKVKI